MIEVILNLGSFFHPTRVIVSNLGLQLLNQVPNYCSPHDATSSFTLVEDGDNVLFSSLPEIL